MSNVSNVHGFAPYVSGKSIPLSGQRLSKITFKTVDGVKKDSVCVSINPVMDKDIEANLSKLLPMFGAYLESVQDKMIREMVEAGKEHVTDEEISIAAIIDYSNQVAQGNRLTKEYIESWFDSSLADSLTVAVADKLGVNDVPTAEQTKVINDTVATYKKKIAAISGSKTNYSEDVCNMLIKALGFAVGDKLADRLVSKLEEMKKQPVADLLAL